MMPLYRYNTSILLILVIYVTTSCLAFINQCQVKHVRYEKMIQMNNNNMPINLYDDKRIIMKNSIFSITSVLSIALMNRNKVNAIDLPECSDSVTIFRNTGGKQIIMIGTAHISEESANLVRRTIKTVKPDVVCT